ncbi:ROK family protein [Demequina capsici]|uniref:ROK family protein n=1 Tax=Demequina capsici TaxID=3075620 RepID=A0AA96FGS4_9MICO|nr:ROK family protein [Demequina sp. PMTSA13]WNM28250.1 ROK family protein [Demequina sp. PMTSA13]
MAAADRTHLTSVDVRDHNLGLVLARLAHRGPAARTAIALDTGLARSAVTGLVAALLEAGLVRAAAEHAAPTVGRPLELLELDGSRIGLVAAQVEVDEITVLAHDLAGRRLWQRTRRVHTPIGDAPSIAALLADAVSGCTAALTEQHIEPFSLDVVVPGLVSKDGSKVLYALDLGWTDEPFLAQVIERAPQFRGGASMHGDAQLAAYAEYMTLRRDPGLADLQHMLYVRSRTGYGAGVVTDGRLFRGGHGTALPPGHLIVQRDGELCDCGRRGCLVTIADPEILVARAGLGAVRESEGLHAAMDALVAHARAGEPAAVRTVTEAIQWIRLMLANLILSYEPEVVVLGGMLGDLVDDIAQMDDALRGFVGLGDVQGRDAFLPARLGDLAAATGAVLLRQQELLAAPVRTGLLPTGPGIQDLPGATPL